MAKSGYVRLWRKSTESAVFADEGTWQLFCWFLLKATHKPLKTILKVGRAAIVVELRPGEYAFRLRLLAADLRISVGTLRRRLGLLRRLECVEVRTSDKYTLVRVRNWASYQADPDGVSIIDTPTDTPTDTHNKNIEKNKNKNKSSCRTCRFDPSDLDTARWMFFLLQRLDPAWKAPNFDAWAAAISLMRRRDGRTDDEIRRVFAWANADPFWRRNILSPEKLRRQYQRLMLEMKNPNGRPRQRPIGPGQWYDPEAAKKDPDHGKM